MPPSLFSRLCSTAGGEETGCYLLCWCLQPEDGKSEGCHARVLFEYVNASTAQEPANASSVLEAMRPMVLEAISSARLQARLNGQLFDIEDLLAEPEAEKYVQEVATKFQISLGEVRAYIKEIYEQSEQTAAEPTESDA